MVKLRREVHKATVVSLVLVRLMPVISLHRSLRTLQITTALTSSDNGRGIPCGRCMMEGDSGEAATEFECVHSPSTAHEIGGIHYADHSRPMLCHNNVLGLLGIDHNVLVDACRDVDGKGM